MSGDRRAWLRPFIAHRGLHGDGAPENSLAACRAALEAGYAIEIDVVGSADGEAMVFHDPTLKRMAGVDALVGETSARDLGAVALAGGSERIPTLGALLELVDGGQPLVIEIKDVARTYEPTDGRLEARIAALLRRYRGPVAVMSFNPHMVRWLQDHAPELPRGLVADNFSDAPWLSEERRAALAGLADLDCADFISYRWSELDTLAVARAREAGMPVACWTVKTPEQARQAFERADAITFEHFRPQLAEYGLAVVAR